MRKVLLATTAIAGSAALAGGAAAQTTPITVTLGGFLDVQGNYTSEKRMGKADQAVRKTGLHTNTELLIIATGTAANGLTYGAYIETEADASSTGGTTNVDENNVFLQGSWGRLELGNQDSFAFTTTGLRAGATDLGGGGVAGDAAERFTVAPTGGTGGAFATASLRGLLSGDFTKITYASPTFSGFQAGISYAPQGGDSNLNSGGETLRSNVQSTTTGGNSLGTAATEDWVEIGAQWGGTFEGVSVKFGGALTMADAKTTSAGASTFEDYKSWAIGTRISFMGFSVGGQYANQGKSGYSKSGRVTGGDTSARAWSSGVAYVTGPFGVHVSYYDSRHEGSVANAGNDTRKHISTGANYIYAPGARVGLELSRIKDKDEGGGTTTSENKSTVFQIIHALVF
jgi:hypothetical protein